MKKKIIKSCFSSIFIYKKTYLFPEAWELGGLLTANEDPLVIFWRFPFQK